MNATQFRIPLFIFRNLKIVSLMKGAFFISLQACLGIERSKQEMEDLIAIFASNHSLGCAISASTLRITIQRKTLQLSVMNAKKVVKI
jgi:hypothetical protein